VCGLAEQKLQAIREKLSARTSRMREFGDAKYLQEWLIKSVRGID